MHFVFIVIELCPASFHFFYILLHGVSCSFWSASYIRFVGRPLLCSITFLVNQKNSSKIKSNDIMARTNLLRTMPELHPTAHLSWSFSLSSSAVFPILSLFYSMKKKFVSILPLFFVLFPPDSMRLFSSVFVFELVLFCVASKPSSLWACVCDVECICVDGKASNAESLANAYNEYDDAIITISDGIPNQFNNDVIQCLLNVYVCGIQRYYTYDIVIVNLIHNTPNK